VRRLSTAKLNLLGVDTYALSRAPVRLNQVDLQPRWCLLKLLFHLLGFKSLQLVLFWPAQAKQSDSSLILLLLQLLQNECKPRCKFLHTWTRSLKPFLMDVAENASQCSWGVLGGPPPLILLIVLSVRDRSFAWK
jgi:hypothetical protein